MQTITHTASYDTLAGVKRLKSKGITAKQAEEAIAEELRMASGFDISGLATKEDLERFATKEYLNKELKQFATKEDLKQFATKEDLEILRGEFKALGTSMDLKFSELKGELTVRIESNKNELLKWFIGIAILQLGGIIALAKLFHQ